MHFIEVEHPEYTAKKGQWRRFRDLYAGGEQLKANASEYLLRRQKEPAPVYAERLERVHYENYIGSITDWYVATLFRREPLLLVETQDHRARRFFATLNEDCDLRGSTLTEFLRRQLIDALVCGTSHVLVDFPRAERTPSTLAEEDRDGTSRAYLSPCRAEQLINWSKDDRGNFEWVVIRNTTARKERPSAEPGVKETRFHYFDRREYRAFSRKGDSEGGEVQLLEEGLHAFAHREQVPLFSMELPEGLWLLNKAGLLQLEHFNKSNALSWALTQGLFATPVVYTEREWNQIVGESYYIQLGPNDRFGWTEPEGRVFQIAADNLGRLKDEIYRVCYLLSQAGGTLTGGTGPSGISKQRDFAITQEVLRALGDVVKDTLKRVLRGIAAVRHDEAEIDVSGLEEFDIGDFSAELADAEKLLALGSSSPTLRRHILKKLALKYLCDVRQEVKDRIALEIDEGVN